MFPLFRSSSLQPLVGKAIRSCRVTLGLSSDELACRLGKPVSYVQQLESAEISLSGSRLQSCADALGIHPAELLDIAQSNHEMLIVGERTLN